MQNIGVQEIVKNLVISKDKPIEKAIYEAFRTAIVNGKIPINNRINAAEYALALNTSRTPVRVALDKLLADGLVAYRPNVGFFACKITANDAKEIYLIRKSLEALVVNTATEKMTQQDFDELEQLLILTEKTNEEGDVQKVISLFADYHRFMYQKSELTRVAEIISRGNEYLHHFRSLCLLNEDRRENALKDHKEIFLAMKDGNKEKTISLIENHLDASLEFLLKNMPVDN